MTEEEIFSQLAQHMIEGLMVHSQLSDFYNFLGLKGFAKCHEYHFYCENGGYRKLVDYYMKHYHKLVVETPFSNPDVIPENWYNFTKQQVDSNTRKTSIQTGFERWVKWEKDTKKLLESMYNELVKINEIASANEISCFINDVDEELTFAQEKLLCYKAIDFDIVEIMSRQEDLYKKYEKKIKEIDLC